MKVIDLFCGCGGLSEGFRLAGFEIVGGIDFNKDAIKSFNENFTGARGVCVDLKNLTEEDIKSEFSDFLSADIIIGGPPCQGFSTANRWQNLMDDERNQLFFEFIKFVDLIKPKAIVIENVRGIITSNNGIAKQRIYEIFESRGYIVTNKIMDASNYGVPQKRLRNFFVIAQKKIDLEDIEKIESPFIKEAIGELYDFEMENKKDVYKLNKSPETKYQKYLRNKDNLILNHEIKYPAPIVQERISHVHQGGNWKDIPEVLFENNRTNRHSSAYKRLNENDFSVTIDTGNTHSNYFHPIFNRIPTVREAARIQSFSDNFIFHGSRTAQYRQVGNAVPPLLAKSIAEKIISELKES